MDACTRPSHTRRQTRKAKSFRLAALLPCVAITTLLAFSSMSSPALSAAQADIAPEDEETGSIAPSSQHEVAIESVPAGQESATLTARLTDHSSKLLKNMEWTVRNAAGDVVYDGAATSAAIALQPGYYDVEARFGGVTMQESFTLLEGTRMDMRFVLNAGGLRVLPRLKGLTTPEITSQTRIFALTGKSRGQMVEQSAVPGEVINLTAGDYRIECRLLGGNAVAVIDVKIQPGIMSAVDIDYHAGLARLAYVGAPNAKVEWEIRRGGTTELANITGLNAKVVLKPGDYTAIARVGTEKLTATFQIREGEERDILLGN